MSPTVVYKYWPRALPSTEFTGYILGYLSFEVRCPLLEYAMYFNEGFYSLYYLHYLFLLSPIYSMFTEYWVF